MDSDLLSQLIDPKSLINLDGLLDAITALVIDCKAPSLKNKNLENFVTRYQKIVEELSRQRLKGTDFCTLKVIGRGSFGEVQLVRHTKTKNIYAMKLLDKDVMLQRSASFWEERDIMTHANSDWIVKLHYAFQDHKFLYIVMEYLPGGDLLNLLQNYDVSEKWVRFYAAELVEAIACLHDMGYIHRDVKPDNVLVTRSGHIKLADFGTCIKMEANGTAKCLIAVGTADYLAPEVLKHQGNSIIFGPEVDWWSLGICIYEMFYEYPPFYDQSTIVLYSNITKHEETLVFPEEPSISSHAKDIVKLFLSKTEMRLGRNGPDEIRAHPFFNDSEWTFDTLKEASPPFVPELKGEDDTKNFMEIEAQLENNIAPPLSKVFSGSQLPFIGFTYGSDLSPINEFTKLNGNIQNTVVVSSNEDIQKDLEAQLDSFKEKLDQMQNLLENEKSARRTVETNLSEIENGKLIQEEVVEDNRKLKIKLETAQLEKRTLIRKLEELLAKKTQDPKGKGPSKNDIKTRDNKIRRLEAENDTLRSDLQRELNRYQDLEGDLYNVRDENNKLVIEVRQLQEELKQREALARLAGPLDSTICQGNLFLKSGKGSKDWKNVWARLDTLTLQLFDELGGRLGQIDVSQIILTRYLTAADLRAKKEQIEQMFQILYYDTSKNAMQSTFMALTRDDCNTWMQHLKKIVPEKK